MAERTDGKVNIMSANEFILEHEPWRAAGPEDHIQFLAWLNNEHSKRQAKGMAKYGTIFQGEPIIQGIEENLDQLFYLYWAMRQLTFIDKQQNTFKHLLEAVMEFGVTEQIGIDIYEALGVKTDGPNSPNSD